MKRRSFFKTLVLGIAGIACVGFKAFKEKDWMADFPYNGTRSEKSKYVRCYHPDVLACPPLNSDSAGMRIRKFIEELFQKKYTCLAADEPNKDMTGYVFFKNVMVDGSEYELAYNPRWDRKKLKDGWKTGIKELDDIRLNIFKSVAEYNEKNNIMSGDHF